MWGEGGAFGLAVLLAEAGACTPRLPPWQQTWASLSREVTFPAGRWHLGLRCPFCLHTEPLSVLMCVFGGGKALDDEPLIIVFGSPV